MVTLFYALSSIAAFAFLGNRFASEMKPKKVKYTPTPEPELYKPTSRDYTNLHAIADAHSDCTAEIAEAFASGDDRKILNAQPIGSKIELHLEDDINMVGAYINGKQVGLTSFRKDNSRLVDLLGKNTPVEAYIGSRVQPAGDHTDRVSVIAFYKVEGIAPTHVTIE
jgi:hypothetical protein